MAVPKNIPVYIFFLVIVSLKFCLHDRLTWTGYICLNYTLSDWYMRTLTLKSYPT